MTFLVFHFLFLEIYSFFHTSLLVASLLTTIMTSSNEMEQNFESQSYPVEIKGKKMKAVFCPSKTGSSSISVIGMPMEGSLAKFKAILSSQSLKEQLPSNMKKLDPLQFLIKCLEGKENHHLQTQFENGNFDLHFPSSLFIFSFLLVFF